MYIAKVYFEDAQDEHHAYRPGDVYPREGLTPSKKRIKELSSDENIRGIPLIAEEPVKKPANRQRKKKNADNSL